MPNINDRIASQNVIRVLSNASAPPSRLANLTDVNSSLKAKDGLILVWNSSDEVFYMTDTIDSSSLIATGIVTFSNTTDSISPTTGAVIVRGGVGIAKTLNVGGDARIVGVVTFGTGSVVIDGTNDSITVGSGITISSTDGITVPSIIILGPLTAESLNISGISTLASAGGITTTGGDLYVGSDLFVKDNLKVSGTSEFIGVATFRGGTINLGDAISDDINVGGEFISNLNPNDDATYDLGIDGKRWRTGRFSGLVTTTDLFVSGLSTFIGNIDIDGIADVDALAVSGVSTFTGVIDANGDLDVDGHTELDNLNVSGIATFTQSVEITGDLTVNGTQTVLNTNILEVEDINIGIASATPKLSDAALDGAGITIHGLAGDKTLTWDNSNSRLAFNTDIYAPNYYAGNYYAGAGTFDGPNGIAYFDNSGKLTGAASTQSGITTTNYILTTNDSGLPVWTTTIDGGEY